MVRKISLIVWVSLMILGIAFFAGCRHQSPHQRGEFIADYISEILDLTTLQEEQLNQYKDEIFQKANQMRANRSAVHEEIVAQLRNESIDQEHLKNLIFKNKAQMEELINLMVERLAEFHQTLTPEQREKLVRKLENFKRWHHYDLE